MEPMMEFAVQNLTILSSATQISFETKAKEEITLPGGGILSATQAGFQLKKSVRTGICRVIKEGICYKGRLIKQSITLTSDVNFALLSLENGSQIKICHPDTITVSPDIIKIYPNPTGEIVKINMLLNEIILIDFTHNLKMKDCSLYIEQSVSFVNQTPYLLKDNTVAKIVVPKIDIEQGDEHVENDVLQLEKIGDLAPYSKEIITFAETKVSHFSECNVFSLIHCTAVQRVLELTPASTVYPGTITYCTDKGEIISTDVIPYTKAGAKIRFRQENSPTIIATDIKTDEKSFHLTVANMGIKEELFRLEEAEEITNLQLNGNNIPDSTFRLIPGLNVIVGTYGR